MSILTAPTLLYTCNATNPVTDAGSSGVNGTLVGSPTAITGHIAGGLGLNGTSQKVTFTDSILNVASTKYTIAAWVNPATTSGGAHNIFTSGASGHYSIQLRRDASDWNLYQSNSGNVNANFSGGVTASIWTHVAAVWDGTNIYLYINAVLKATTSCAGRDNAGSVGGWGVDDADGSSLQLWDGGLDELRILNAASTGTDILALYNYTGATSSLVPWHRLKRRSAA